MMKPYYTWDDVRALAEERGLRFSSGQGSGACQEQVWVGRPGSGHPKAFVSPTCIVEATDPDGPDKMIAWIEEVFPLPIIPERPRRVVALVPLDPPYSRRSGLLGLLDQLFYR